MQVNFNWHQIHLLFSIRIFLCFLHSSEFDTSFIQQADLSGVISIWKMLDIKAWTRGSHINKNHINWTQYWGGIIFPKPSSKKTYPKQSCTIVQLISNIVLFGWGIFSQTLVFMAFYESIQWLGNQRGEWMLKPKELYSKPAEFRLTRNTKAFEFFVNVEDLLTCRFT